jgi:regulator of RNase E activity RraA
MDALIHPGDYIIADLDGVVCLPKDLAERAIGLIPSQVEADQRMAKAIKDGVTFSEASKKYRSQVKQP